MASDFFIRGEGGTKEHSLRACSGVVIGNRIDLQKRRSGVDLNVGDGHHLSDFPGKWGYDLHLHLHGLEHRQAVSNATVSPGLTRMETTTDGAGACTTPPSSRSIRCDTPSTSIR